MIISLIWEGTNYLILLRKWLMITIIAEHVNVNLFNFRLGVGNEQGL